MAASAASFDDDVRAFHGIPTERRSLKLLCRHGNVQSNRQVLVEAQGVLSYDRTRFVGPEEQEALACCAALVEHM